ncbi:class II fumarate hydratase [Ideonella margarita]|uniref:Fumarate hydratase class II n=1 Tax=Ideonella margarita TaxID=2984191 RepID=A0ABU9C7S8_9BURK
MPDGFRLEHDSMGDIPVAHTALWGAQTQRALLHFAISTEQPPWGLWMALVHIKRAAAEVNAELGLLPPAMASAIVDAAAEMLAGHHPGAFPLGIWQTGSGTPCNMNVNEVLANRASELMGAGRGNLRCVHPNDHVNLGQSSNDVFPTAMHLAAGTQLSQQLLPALQRLRDTLHGHATRHAQLVKLGRTHLQDATPITVGQEVSGWVAQLDAAQAHLHQHWTGLLGLAIGGTAVGTGLNTHPAFGTRMALWLAADTGLAWHCADNRFAALAAHDALVSLHGALKGLAVALTRIANDLRWLASGPRGGLGEWHLPPNEPGSSIMPGKVNPTQCEAMLMLCMQVMANDVAMSFGGAAGMLELNTAKPLLAHNLLQSLRLLADGMTSFERHCVAGMQPDAARMRALLDGSLMLVTALAPHIGYEAAAAIAQRAEATGSSLREAALALGSVNARDFDAWTDPANMV